MRVTVIGVGPLQQGKDFPLGYYTLKLACEDGTFAVCYTGPDFRNWRNWSAPIQVGNTYTGARVLAREADDKGPRLIDGDSSVSLDTKGPACAIGRKLPPRPKPELRQGEFFQFSVRGTVKQ